MRTHRPRHPRPADPAPARALCTGRTTHRPHTHTLATVAGGTRYVPGKRSPGSRERVPAFVAPVADLHAVDQAMAGLGVRALTTVVATCYLLGVSTRRMDKLVETLGITSLSKSQVSVMAKELDAAVEAFRTRPLDAGPYTFMAADALVLKVREGGRVVNVHALIAVGVNKEGYREILGIDVTTAEDGAGWLKVLFPKPRKNLP